MWRRSTIISNLLVCIVFEIHIAVFLSVLQCNEETILFLNNGLLIKQQQIIQTTTQNRTIKPFKYRTKSE